MIVVVKASGRIECNPGRPVDRARMIAGDHKSQIRSPKYKDLRCSRFIPFFVHWHKNVFSTTALEVGYVSRMIPVALKLFGNYWFVATEILGCFKFVKSGRVVFFPFIRCLFLGKVPMVVVMCNTLNIVINITRPILGEVANIGE